MKTSSQRQPLSWLTSLTGKTLMVASLAVVTLFACKKTSDDATDSSALSKKAITAGDFCDGLGYKVTLLGGAGIYDGTNTTYTWEVINQNPGSGKGTPKTFQDLSHFSIAIEDCAVDSEDDIVSAKYKQGNGAWTPVALSAYEVDPSIGACFTTEVLKFDVGTIGADVTLYKLVLEGEWTTSATTAFFKSGSNTTCCKLVTLGVGCRIKSDECLYSQGYWFNKPGVEWPIGVVNIGGITYTEAEGRAIGNAPNYNGMKDSKKAFKQLAAVLLSGYSSLDPAASAAKDAINCFLNGKDLRILAPFNQANTGANSKQSCVISAKDAARTLSELINSPEHCDQKEVE
jgi:hypothetical protein